MKSETPIQENKQKQIKRKPVLKLPETGSFIKNTGAWLPDISDINSWKIVQEKETAKVSRSARISRLRKTDTELTEVVLAALKLNTSVPVDKLNIKVENGVVTLIGQVNWVYQRNAAIAAIENLAGINRIYNYIAVKKMLL